MHAGGGEGAGRPAEGTRAIVDELLRLVVRAPARRSRIPTGRGVPQPHFLFSVDHCFALKGQGTVLTGTVLSGSIKVRVPSVLTSSWERSRHLSAVCCCLLLRRHGEVCHSWNCCVCAIGGLHGGAAGAAHGEESEEHPGALFPLQKIVTRHPDITKGMDMHASHCAALGGTTWYRSSRAAVPSQGCTSERGLRRCSSGRCRGARRATARACA